MDMNKSALPPVVMDTHDSKITAVERNTKGRATKLRVVCSCGQFTRTGSSFMDLDSAWYAHITEVRRAAGWTADQLAAAAAPRGRH